MSLTTEKVKELAQKYEVPMRDVRGQYKIIQTRKNIQKATNLAQLKEAILNYIEEPKTFQGLVQELEEL